MKNFENKVVVITGAGSGMGRAYALAFAKLGAKLALSDINRTALAETSVLLQSSAAKAVYTEIFDVSDRDAMYAFAAQVSVVLGDAHVIINNAGVEGACHPVWATDDVAFEKIMRINFNSVVYGTKAFLPQLLRRGEGAIVNVSSIFGLVGTPNHADYCASKFAVRGFTEALMVELQESPITVHLVHPGGIATNIAVQSGSQAFAQKYLNTSPDAIAQVVIQSIRKNRVKIVYGQDSFKTWLGANFVPLKLLNRMIWRELKQVIDLQHYLK